MVYLTYVVSNDVIMRGFWIVTRWTCSKKWSVLA